MIDAFEVTNDYGQNLRLLRIRNPWGHGEWKGDYSDNSSLWTSELKYKVGYENREDGLFFMKWEDFCYCFTSVQFSVIEDSWDYCSFELQQKNFNYNCLKVRVNTPGEYYFSVI